MSVDIKQIITSTDNYNLHSHSQFCDGRDTMEQIAAGARKEGMEYFAFTPHSPLCIPSPCNMDIERVGEYFQEFDRLKDLHYPEMHLLRSFEIDYLSDDFGPHIDWFQSQPLDFRLGSVHFVPNQEGEFLDCDGKFERFSRYLREKYRGDIRYVAEKYFEQVLRMLERGGFELLGHFDKIAGNGSEAYPGLEDEGWYESLVDDVISHAVSSGVAVEINTKAYEEKGRFYPAERWWGKIVEAGVPIAVDSDAHWASKVNSGRKEAMEKLCVIKDLHK